MCRSRILQDAARVAVAEDIQLGQREQ
jgi:hypothetical protein